jgi:hypothetical protein
MFIELAFDQQDRTDQRQGRVLGWRASCQDQDFVIRLYRGEDCAETRATEATRAVEEARLRERRSERTLALWLGSKAAVGTQAFDPRAFEYPGAAA